MQSYYDTHPTFIFGFFLICSFFFLQLTDVQRIPEKERRRSDIGKMGDPKLGGIVLRCIEDASEARPSAEEISEWLQKEMSKVKQKMSIALMGKPRQPPKLKSLPLAVQVQERRVSLSALYITVTSSLMTLRVAKKSIQKASPCMKRSTA